MLVLLKSEYGDDRGYGKNSCFRNMLFEIEVFSGLRSQVVYSKQPKLGLTQEFVVLLVRMRLVVCMYVCLFVCLFVITCLFVCFTGNLGDWVLGRGGSLLLLEKLWDFLLQ